jgi:hypothetical protein
MISVRFALMALATTQIALPNPAWSQRRATILFYHGDGKTGEPSQPVAMDGGRLVWRDIGAEHFTVAPGGEVCVRIVNAHPVFYAYALDANVDSTGEKLPDLSQFTQLLGPLLGQPSQPSPAAPVARIKSALAVIQWYIDGLTNLAKDLEVAQQVTRQSDRPEELAHANEQGPDTFKVGFRYAKRVIMRELPDSAGRFRDPQLGNTLAGWYDRALKNAGQDPTLTSVVIALRAYGEAELRSRDALRDAYSAAKPFVVRCERVGQGTTTIKLKISKKDSSATRDVGTGDSLLTVEAEAAFTHKAIELDPFAYASFATQVPDFQIMRDTIIETRDQAVAYGVGTMLTLYPATFGHQKMFSAGVGLGLGVAASSDVVEALFVGIILNFRDAVRFGIGIGGTRFPKRVKGANVGEPLPADAGSLDKLIEREMRPSFQIIFAMPGLKLGS